MLCHVMLKLLPFNLSWYSKPVARENIFRGPGSFTGKKQFSVAKIWLDLARKSKLLPGQLGQLEVVPDRRCLCASLHPTFATEMFFRCIIAQNKRGLTDDCLAAIQNDPDPDAVFFDTLSDLLVESVDQGICRGASILPPMTRTRARLLVYHHKNART